MSYSPSDKAQFDNTRQTLSDTARDHILNQMRQHAMMLCAAEDNVMGNVEAAFRVDRVQLLIDVLREVADEFEHARGAMNQYDELFGRRPRG